MRRELKDILREVRIQKGMTQEQLAHAIDVHQTHISQYETGRLKLEYEKAKKLAQVLDVPIGLLFQEKDTLIKWCLEFREIDHSRDPIEGEFEVPPWASDGDIEKEVKERAMEHIEIGWNREEGE